MAKQLIKEAVQRRSATQCIFNHNKGGYIKEGFA